MKTGLIWPGFFCLTLFIVEIAAALSSWSVALDVFAIDLAILAVTVWMG